MNDATLYVSVLSANANHLPKTLPISTHSSPAVIQASQGAEYLITTVNNGPAPRFVTLKRIGKNIILSETDSPDSPQLIIEGYYDHPGSITGIGEDGSFYAYIANDGDTAHEAVSLNDGSTSVLKLNQEVSPHSASFWTPEAIGWGAAGAALALVGIGVAASGGGRRSGGSSEKSSTAPDTPAAVLTDSTGSLTGMLDSGDHTDDTKPELNGNGMPGNTVIIHDNGEPLGSVQVSPQGEWQFTPETDLTQGSHSFVFTEYDKNGNQSPPSKPHILIVDSEPPLPPILDTVMDATGHQTGELLPGTVTDEANPKFSGTAEANSIVYLYDNMSEIPVGSTQADAGGKWHYQPDVPFMSGMHTITAVAVDPAQNSSQPSAPFTFMVASGEIPSIPVIVFAEDNHGPVKGPLQKGDATDDTQVTLHGTGTPGDIITLWLNTGSGTENLGSVIAEEDGKWAFRPDGPLSSGDYSFSATATSPTGNHSAMSSGWPLIINTRTPDVAENTSLQDNINPSTGQITEGSYTNDRRPVYSGTAQEGATVIIFNKGQEIGRVPVGTEGNWHFVPDNDLPLGENSISTVVQDILGNQSDSSEAIHFTVVSAPETTAPIMAVSKGSADDQTNLITNDGSAGRLISGTLSSALNADEKVQISLDSGIQWQDVILDSFGNWHFHDNAIHSQNWHIQTQIVNGAGVSGTVTTREVTLDTRTPEAPTAISLVNDIATVRFNSTAHEGDNIILVFDGRRISTALNENDIRNGSINIAVPASTSEKSLSATIVSPSGNHSGYLSNTITTYENFSGGDTTNLEGFRLRPYARLPLSFAITGEGEDKALRLGTSEGRNEGFLEFDQKTPSTEVWFTVSGVASYATASFFDVNGSFISQSTITFERTLMPKEYHYKTTGKAISWVEFALYNEPGGITVDNFRISAASDNVTTLSDQFLLGGHYYGSDKSDTFSLDDGAFFLSANNSLSGGKGIDTLALTSSSDTIIDLTQATKEGKISSVEVIDLTGHSSNNMLSLSLADVLTLGANNVFLEDGHTQLKVKGNTGDMVVLSDLLSDGADIGDWVEVTSTLTLGAETFNVWRHNTLAAELLVQNEVSVTAVNH